MSQFFSFANHFLTEHSAIRAHAMDENHPEMRLEFLNKFNFVFTKCASDFHKFSLGYCSAIIFLVGIGHCPNNGTNSMNQTNHNSKMSQHFR